MGIALQVDTHRDLFVETARGVVCARDLFRLLATKAQWPDRKPALGTLADFRNCQLQLSMEELRGLATESAKSHVGPLAIVVNDDLNYALARQYQAFRESFTGMGSVRVTRDLDAADAWLRDNVPQSA